MQRTKKYEKPKNATLSFMEKKTGWEGKRIGGEGLVMKTTEDFFSFKYK